MPVPNSGTSAVDDRQAETLPRLDRAADGQPLDARHQLAPRGSRPSCQAEERQTVGQLVGPLGDRLADAVAGPALLEQQDRPLVLARRRRLQQRGHLAGVQRVDAGVALGRREQRRRVARALDDAVVRRVGVQPGELLGDVGVAVLARPQPGDQELREAHHVEQRHAAPHGPAQVGALGEGDADEQPAVRAAEDRPAARGWRGARSTSQSAAAWKSSNTFCLLARRPAWCHASPSSSPPRRPAMAYRPPAAHQAAICGDHTGVSEMAKPP